MTVAEKIRFFRQEKGLQQKQLAELSGVQVKTIQRYEHGTYEPTQKTLKKIADAINIPIQCFLDIHELIEHEEPFLRSLSQGKRIRVLRLSIGKSQEELSALTDIPLLSLQAYEADERFLKLSDMSRLTIGLDIPHTIFPIDGRSEAIKQNKYGRMPDSGSDSIKRYLLNLIEPELIETQKKQIESGINRVSNHEIGMLIYYLACLNETGKNKLFDYVQDLTTMEKYTSPDPDEE